jgi:fructuronate reductase
VHEWWAEASRYLPQSAETLAEYQAQLTDRFTNPRMRHLLAQIASDGTQKLRMRTVPILRRERAFGRRGLAALRTLAHWIAYLHTEPADLVDPLADRLRATRRTRNLLAMVDPDLAGDDSVVADLDELVSQHRKGI